MIVDWGRGPEITGTRITVYCVMDFLIAGCPLPEIATALGLTERQVQAAIDYIDEHHAEVEAEYAKIMRRVNRLNPPEIEAALAKTPEELRRRIMAHRAI